MTPPSNSAEFDRAYRSPVAHWLWTDARIPQEIKALARQTGAQRALELGCGVGRFSRYLAQQGVRVTALDFSPAAIEKARASVRHDRAKPEFMVGDVTRLDLLNGPFDISFDVGCFHCLDEQGRRAYVSGVARLLRPGGTHLVWALDAPPSDLALSPVAVEQIFGSGFEMQQARKSRRRLVSSHWYWLIRAAT